MGLARQLPQIKSDYQKLMQSARDAGISPPKPYYALLSFDGDKMGATWAGDTEYIPAEVDLMAFQQELAKQLARFAQNASTFLNESRGETVYAGGDDFTGFVSIDHLFEVLYHLRELYRTEVNNPIGQKYGLKKELSFSAGICIAHYKKSAGRGGTRSPKRPEIRQGYRWSKRLCLFCDETLRRDPASHGQMGHG